MNATTRIWLLSAVLCSVVVIPAFSQSGARPRQLNEQLQRARTALVSGTSLLEAKARVDRVVSALPNDAEARVLRAEILLAMGRYDAAAEDAIVACELQPNNGTAHLTLAEAAFHIGDPATAERSMDRSSQLLVDDGGAHVRLSRLARELGLQEQSVAFARIAVALAPANARANYELARAFVFASKTDAAASVLANGLEAGLLASETVLSDSLLQILQKHPALRSWF